MVPMETRREVIVRAAVLADELGYELFSVPEGWGLDSTLILTEIALRTRQIKMASAVLSVWGRTPGTLAMTAATLHQLSGGRYVLGLGPSTRGLVEGFHDRPFAHPAQQLREVTTRVRTLLAGEQAVLDNVPGARPIRLGQPPVPDLPIWLAAMGSRTVQVAAELADGWMPLYVGRERLTSWQRELAAVRAAAGQRSAPLTVAAGPTAVVDDDPGIARHVAAANTAFYLCAMGDIYSRLVAEQGYAAEVQAIRAANPRPRPQDAVVPPEAEVILDQFAAHGTPTQVRDRLESWDSAVDILSIVCPAGLPWDTLEATIRAAAP
jgi:alkanesulfonate monooxygenase SsuD/methylene tetrahydromethanopterin reductase-like flavin-dependent oxidoreductase (luciferase family)